jgi:hypothetical protein
MPILSKILSKCIIIKDEISYCGGKFQLNKILHSVIITYNNSRVIIYRFPSR